MNYLKISLGIFIVLAASRFVPHPPNFTSLIALSLYVPLIFGLKFLPVLILSFIVTDLFIGFHSLALFTWGSIIFISLVSKFFRSKIYFRIFGALISACLFFLITNFGVWSMGSYGYTFEGLALCYILAIPFFGNTLVSTLLYSLLIELLLKISKNFFKLSKV